jgi:hypothetical protein
MHNFPVIDDFEESYFWLQHLTSAGTWTDVLGSQDIDTILHYKDFLEKNNDRCRVVTKTLHVIDVSGAYHAQK